LTAEVARLLVPNLLLGNTILLTNTRSYPQQAQRIGEIIDAGDLPPGSLAQIFRETRRDTVLELAKVPVLQGMMRLVESP